MEDIKIIVFDEDELTPTLILNYLQESGINYKLDKYKEFDEELVLSSNSKSIIIFNINSFNTDILNKISKISKRKNLFFIAISNENSTDLIVKTLRTGVNDFLSKPLVKSDFLYSIQQICKSYFNEKKPNNSPQIFSILSEKNETEQNTILFNLASELQKLSRSNVLIIDIPYSDFCISNLYNISQKFYDFYFEDIEKDIPAYNNRPLFLTNIKQEDIKNIKSIINKLKEYFDYIFINIPTELQQDYKTELVNISNELFYIINGKYIKSSVINDFNLYLKNNRFEIIFNNYDLKSQNKLERIQTHLGVKIKYTLPKNFIATEKSIQYKISINEYSSDLAISKKYVNLAKEIMNRMIK